MLYYHVNRESNEIMYVSPLQKRLDPFTLRGRIKVNIEWMLYCMVHNIEKILHFGTSYAVAAYYFAEVEQAAFNPANVVPGIGFSPDKMLQGRLFSYGDAQSYRLGVNHHQIPVNAPRCPYHSYHRDGMLRADGNYGSTLGYEPNSYDEWRERPDFAEPPLKIEGAADHWNFRKDDDDYYTQPGKLFRLMSAAQQKVLFENTARAMGDAPKKRNKFITLLLRATAKRPAGPEQPVMFW